MTDGNAGAALSTLFLTRFNTHTHTHTWVFSFRVRLMFDALNLN